MWGSLLMTRGRDLGSRETKWNSLVEIWQRLGGIYSCGWFENCREGSRGWDLMREWGLRELREESGSSWEDELGCWEKTERKEVRR